MGLIDRIMDGSYVPEDAEPAPRETVARTSLASIAHQARGGAGALPLVRDLLDAAQRGDESVVWAMIEDEPQRSGREEIDALLAGIAELLADERGLVPPTWVVSPERFLDRMWFVSGVPGFRATALAQTPVALKRRGVFWPRRSLQRV